MRTRKPKTLLFIGFRHKTDSIVAARDAGYKTVLITRKAITEAEPYFDEIIERDVTQKEVLDELIPLIKEKYAVKSIISNYEHFVVPRSYFAEHLGIPSCSVYSACCTRNKSMQRHALKFMAENISHQTVKTKAQALRAFKSLGEDVFIKTIAGIKSRGVFHVESEEEMVKAVEALQAYGKNLDTDLYDDYEYCDFQFEYPDPRNHFLVEKAERGQQITVASLVGGYQIWHAPSVCDVYTAKDIGRDDSFLAYRITPSKHPKEFVLKAKKVVETATRILGLQHCCIHSELIINQYGDLKLIEIASRMGGYRPQMFSAAFDLDINEQLVKAVVGKEVKTRRAPRCYVSMIEIFPSKEGVITEIKGIEELKNDASVSNFKQKLSVGDKAGKAKNGHENVLSFLIRGKTYNEVKQKSDFYHKLLEVCVA